MKIAKILNSRFRNAKILKSAEILNSGFWNVLTSVLVALGNAKVKISFHSCLGSYLRGLLERCGLDHLYLGRQWRREQVAMGYMRGWDLSPSLCRRRLNFDLALSTCDVPEGWVSILYASWSKPHWRDAVRVSNACERTFRPAQNFPGGDSRTLDFIVRRWLGVSGSGESGSVSWGERATVDYCLFLTH